MLARIDNELKASRVEVDRTGTLFRVRPLESADRTIAILKDSGAEPQLLRGKAAFEREADAQRWYTRETIAELSKDEFRILAQRGAAKVGKDAKLNAGQIEQLTKALQDEAIRALDEYPPEVAVEESVWQARKLAGVKAAVAKVGDSMTTQQRKVVEEGLGEAL